MFRWNWLKDENPNILNAIARESDRQIWRILYQERAAYNLGRVHMVVPCPNPVKPDLIEEDPIDEPSDLEDFLEELKIAFQSASAGFLEELNAFRGVPRVSLVRLADRFDEVADPLLRANPMTTRGLALNLRIHIPAHIRRATLGAMMREELRRFILQLPLVEKDDLLTMMRNAEAFWLEFETEQRAASLTPSPHDTDLNFPAPAFPPKIVPRPMEERLGGGAKDIKDRLGPRQEPTQDPTFLQPLQEGGAHRQELPWVGTEFATTASSPSCTCHDEWWG